MEDISKLLAEKAVIQSALNGSELWLLFFGILVVIGVAGESFFGIKNWRDNRKLHGVELAIDEYRQTEIAAANERAATAEQHATATEERLDARRLTPSQVSALIVALRTHQRNATISIRYEESDPEAMEYATELENIFKRAEWLTSMSTGYLNPPGLTLVFGPAEDAVNTIETAFRWSNVDYAVRPEGNNQSSALLLVGRKPIVSIPPKQ